MFGMTFSSTPTGPGGPDEIGGGTAILDRELEKLLNEEQTDDPGDHDKFSHYVRKEKILESAVTGKAVRALCGKKWLPNSNPDRFPVCPNCKAVYDKMKG